jgi:hypothetical protein
MRTCPTYRLTTPPDSAPRSHAQHLAVAAVPSPNRRRRPLGSETPLLDRAWKQDRSSGDALDDLDQLVYAVTLAACEVDQLSGTLEHGSPLGRPCNRDATPAPELEQALVAKEPQRTQHRVRIDAEYGGEILGRGKGAVLSAFLIAMSVDVCTCQPGGRSFDSRSSSAMATSVTGAAARRGRSITSGLSLKEGNPSTSQMRSPRVCAATFDAARRSQTAGEALWAARSGRPAGAGRSLGYLLSNGCYGRLMLQKQYSSAAPEARRCRLSTMWL